MGGEWDSVALHEIVDFQPKRKITKGACAPFVAMADIAENQKNISRIGKRMYNGGGSRFKNGDTLFARITPCLENGKTAFVSGLESDTVAHGSTEFIVMSARNPAVDAQFIYYLSRLPEFRSFAESQMEGTSGRQRVAWQSLSQYELRCPNSDIRKRIGEILGTLDDKIELNRQMNTTLEAMAQALFKSWFVDFDPVIDKALAAGHPIPEALQTRAAAAAARQALGDKRKPLPAEIQQHFPDRFVFNEEMGWVPQGWRIETLDTVCAELRRGISPKYLDDGGVRVINQKCIRNHEINFSLARRNDPNKRKVAGREIRVGDVLVNSTGVGTLGRMAQVKELSETTVVDSHVTLMRPENDIFHPFVFGQAMLCLEPTIEAMGEGSTGQTELSRANLQALNVVVPSLACQGQLERQLGNLAARQTAATANIAVLASLRDTLLPKLLSGQLRIPEAEKQVAQAL